MEVKDCFKKHNMNIKGVIHIGGHVGHECQEYINMGIKNILYFEPQPHIYDKLKHHLNNLSNANPNVSIDSIHCALGSENKKMNMYVEKSYNNSASSSLLKPKKHLEQYPGIQFNDIIEVDVRKLDDVDYDITKYNFINIDTQGYELEVFTGAVDKLAYIDYIYAEVNREELYENCVQIDGLDAFLTRLGFSRVEIDWTGGTWGEAFYIKK